MEVTLAEVVKFTSTYVRMLHSPAVYRNYLHARSELVLPYENTVTVSLDRQKDID